MHIHSFPRPWSTWSRALILFVAICFIAEATVTTRVRPSVCLYVRMSELVHADLYIT